MVEQLIKAVAMHQTLLILWKLVNILNRICLFDHTNRALVNNSESFSELRLQPLEVKDSGEGQNDDHNGDDPNYARSQEPVLGSVSHILPVDIVRKNSNLRVWPSVINLSHLDSPVILFAAT